jgi:hypothetical protein
MSSYFAFADVTRFVGALARNYRTASVRVEGLFANAWPMLTTKKDAGAG